jgi:hypothetical protein
MYSANGRKEVITCRVSAYPEPRVTLMYNDQQIQADKYSLEENKNVPRQVYIYDSIVDKNSNIFSIKIFN